VNVEQSATERQLQAQGDREEANRVRRLRQKLRAERQKVRELRRENRQEDREDLRDDRDEFDDYRRGRILERRGDRIVVDLGGGRIVVRSEFEDESERLLYGARDVEVIELPNGRTRTVVYREDDIQIITVRNRYGDIVSRSRRYPDNREVVLIEDIYVEEEEAPRVYQPIQLPPLVVSVPEEEYIVEYAEATPQEIQEVLVAPPVERVERAYSVQEVTTNVRVRDKMSRIDLDAITFEFGSATIGPDQTNALDELGFAMEEVIAANPEEVYLIEGHTDAVGRTRTICSCPTTGPKLSPWRCRRTSRSRRRTSSPRAMASNT
jgi:flagellar motor protein MotB